MNKKGMAFYMVSLVVISLVILTTALIDIKHNRQIEKVDGKVLFLGEGAINIMKSYSKGEQALFYVDLAAKYATVEALAELAAHGGFGEQPACGQYKGDTVWYNKGTFCFPEEFGKEFTPHMNKILDSYLQNYAVVSFPKDNYDISVKQEEDIMQIFGRARRPVEFVISGTTTPMVGGAFSGGAAAQAYYDPSETVVHQAVSVEGCEIAIPGADTYSTGYPGSKSKSLTGNLVNGYNMAKGSAYTFTSGSINGLNGMYGTKELAYSLMATGCALKQKFGIKLKHGDLSLQSGGDIKGHGSHESGRDVDIIFIWKKAGSESLRQYSGQAVKDPPPKRGSGIKDKCPKRLGWREEGAGFPVDPEFYMPANWELVKNWLLNSENSAIFLHCDIIRAMKDYAIANDPQGWASVQKDFNNRMQFWANHHNHYHMRICCPDGDLECKNSMRKCSSVKIA